MAVNFKPLPAKLTVLDVMQDGPVIPVMVIHDPADAAPLAQALLRGGIRMLEITLRTPKALACIEAIAKHVPEAVVGAGTVCTVGQARAARDAGARFLVSPGYTSRLGLGCRELEIPLLPGVVTSGEIMQAVEDGYKELKFFPAMQAGGSAMVHALHGPFSEVNFCPTGGINLINATEFLALPNVRCVGGSWLTPLEAIAAGDWGRIEALAHGAASLRQL